MSPALLHFRILGLSVGLSVFGLFLGLGAGVAAAVVALAGRPAGLSARVGVALCFWAAAAGVIAARLGGMLVGGATHGLPLTMNYAVGLAAAAAATVMFCRSRGLSAWLGLDLLGCGLAAAHAVVSLGCFAAGCCYGRMAAPGALWALPLGQDTIAWHELAARGLVPLAASATPPLYPVQVTQALALAGVTLLLVWMARRPRSGRVLAAYLLAAPAVWLALAPWRAHAWQGVASVTGLAAAGIALTLWRYAYSWRGGDHAGAAGARGV